MHFAGKTLQEIQREEAKRAEAAAARAREEQAALAAASAAAAAQASSGKLAWLSNPAVTNLHAVTSDSTQFLWLLAAAADAGHASQNQAQLMQWPWSTLRQKLQRKYPLGLWGLAVRDTQQTRRACWRDWSGKSFFGLLGLLVEVPPKASLLTGLHKQYFIQTRNLGLWLHIVAG